MGDKILITGGLGFTGQHLGRALSREGFDVKLLTDHQAQLSDDELEVICCNILDEETLTNEITNLRPDYVVHLAAIAFANEKNHGAYYDVNVIGTCNLLASLEQVSPTKVILASSANVYGDPGSPTPIREDTLPAPVSHYAASKLAMENMAATWFDRLPIIISRPFNYTGVGQAKQFLVPKIVSHFVNSKSTIELGNLDVSRDYSSIDDVVSAYRELLFSEVTGQRVNICSGKSIQLLSIVNWLQEISGHSIEVQVNPTFIRKNELKELVGDNSKLKSVTSWEPMRDFYSVLQEMYDYGE